MSLVFELSHAVLGGLCLNNEQSFSIATSLIAPPTGEFKLPSTQLAVLTVRQANLWKKLWFELRVKVFICCFQSSSRHTIWHLPLYTKLFNHKPHKLQGCASVLSEWGLSGP